MILLSEYCNYSAKPIIRLKAEYNQSANTGYRIPVAKHRISPNICCIPNRKDTFVLNFYISSITSERKRNSIFTCKNQVELKSLNAVDLINH